jgi:hypothetical protein
MPVPFESGPAHSEIGRGLARADVLALAANPVATTTFDQLDAANRYSIVYRLNAVKRPTGRDRKLAEYVDVLARGESLDPRKPREGHRCLYPSRPTARRS